MWLTYNQLVDMDLVLLATLMSNDEFIAMCDLWDDIRAKKVWVN